MTNSNTVLTSWIQPTNKLTNTPSQAFVAFKAKNYLKIIHELKASDTKKDASESKAEYLEALSSFVNNTPARGWHKEVRPRLTSAVQDFFYYAPDGTKIRTKKEAETYCDDRRFEGLYNDGLTAESFSFAKVPPQEVREVRARGAKRRSAAIIEPSQLVAFSTRRFAPLRSLLR